MHNSTNATDIDGRSISAPTLTPNDVVRLSQWNATEAAYETGLRLGDLVQRGVRKNPAAIAIRFEGQDVSYAELDRMAWALASRLRASGITPGDLVGVCLSRSVELLVALVGVTYSGGACVPLDPSYPLERLSHMCEDANLTHIVTREMEWETASAAFPNGLHTIKLDKNLDQWPVTIQTLQGTPDDIAYVIFTSGSTGRPKGAINAHKGIVHYLQWLQQTFPLTALDRFMHQTPYSFDPSYCEIFWPLMVGATIVVARPNGHRDVEYLAGLIHDEHVTVLQFVPSMLLLFLEKPRGEQCTSVRQMFCGGEALSRDAVDRFFAIIPRSRLTNIYGPTEAAIGATDRKSVV